MYTPFNAYGGDALLGRDSLRLTRNRLLTRVTAPVAEPVTLSEAKLYLRVDSSDEDTLINDLITASRLFAENWLRRSLMSQSWKIVFDLGVPESVWLPVGPVVSVASVVVINQDGSTQTMDSSSYWLNAAQNAIVMNGMLTGFKIQITYNTGYGDATAVPKPIKQGMLTHIAAMYDSRGEMGADLPNAAVALYTPFREVRL